MTVTLLLHCPDRPGIIADITNFITENRGNVVYLAQFVDHVENVFNMRMEWSIDDFLIPRDKIRTKKKVMQRQLQKMIEQAENGLDYNGKCFISESDPEAGNEFRKMVEDTFPNLKGKVQLFPIGATVGAHTGPGTVALFFWGQKRVD